VTHQDIYEIARRARSEQQRAVGDLIVRAIRKL